MVLDLLEWPLFFFLVVVEVDSFMLQLGCSKFMLTFSGVLISSALWGLPLAYPRASDLHKHPERYLYPPHGNKKPHPSALFHHQGAPPASGSTEVASTSQSTAPDTSVGAGRPWCCWLEKQGVSIIPLKIHPKVTCYLSSFPHVQFWWVTWQYFPQDIPHSHPHSVVHFCFLPSLP